MALQAMAESDEFGALIALGCIARGETYHSRTGGSSGRWRDPAGARLPAAHCPTFIITTENAGTKPLPARPTRDAAAARVYVEMANC